MTILERKAKQDQILQDTVTLTITVQRTEKGEYAAKCDEYPEEFEYVWPTMGEAMEHLIWNKVEDIMKEQDAAAG